VPLFSAKPDYAAKSRFKTAPKTTVKLTGLTTVESKTIQQTEGIESRPTQDEPFTIEQLQHAWAEFAELRKIYQAEYQLLSQPFTMREKQIVVPLMHPVQETMLANIKSELTLFLREKLKNNTIIITGELDLGEDKKMIYTPRDKFEYLANKNPVLNELKERLGLDTDF